MFGRSRRHRRASARQREPLSDEAFLSRLSPLTAVPELVLAIRRSLAGMCHVPPEAIYDTDKFDVLVPMMASGLLFGWDGQDFTFRMELHLRRKLLIWPSELPPLTTPKCLLEDPGQPYSVGEWIQLAAPLVEERLGSAFR